MTVVQHLFPRQNHLPSPIVTRRSFGASLSTMRLPGQRPQLSSVQRGELRFVRAFKMDAPVERKSKVAWKKTSIEAQRAAFKKSRQFAIKNLRYLYFEDDAA